MDVPVIDYTLKPRWKPLHAFFGVAFLSVIGGAFLFGGTQVARVVCTRSQVGVAPDCSVKNEAMGGFISREQRVEGVYEVRQESSRGGSIRGSATWMSGVRMLGASGQVRLGRGSSNMNGPEKSEAVRSITEYLRDLSHLSPFYYDLKLFNFLGVIGAGALIFGTFLVWGIVSSFFLPARIWAIRSDGVLRVRRNPGQLFALQIAMARIRSVDVMTGAEAFRRVYPRLFKMIGPDGAQGRRTEHGQSILLMGLEDGREVVIPNWVPVERLNEVAAGIRELLGLRPLKQPLESISTSEVQIPEESPDVFKTGHPVLYRFGLALAALAACVILYGAAPILSRRLSVGALFGFIPNLGIGGILFLFAKELLLLQEITPDPPVIRIRRWVLGKARIHEVPVSDFSRIELVQRRGKSGVWCRALLVSARGNRSFLVFAQGKARSQVLGDCQRMARLTGLPFQGGMSDA